MLQKSVTVFDFKKILSTLKFFEDCFSKNLCLNLGEPKV